MGYVIAAISAAISALCAVAIYHEGQEWERFVKEHSCKQVTHIRGGVGTGFSTSGNFVTIVEPDKTGWLCDDGKTYIR